MSLGAASGRVQRMILAEGGVLLAADLALGILGSLVATRLIQGLLFGVCPARPGDARHRGGADGVRGRRRPLDSGAPGSGNRSMGRDPVAAAAFQFVAVALPTPPTIVA
jgi:hypothetical protein